MPIPFYSVLPTGQGLQHAFAASGISILISIGLLSTAEAAVNDVFPGDYVAAPAGLNAFSTYLYKRNFSGVYSGTNLDKTRDLHSDIVVFLGARYFDWLGQRMMVSLSGGVTALELTERASGDKTITSGVFDPKISWAMWPYMSAEKGRYLLVGLSYIPGWGDYVPSLGALNVGQNRDRGVISLAWSGRVMPAYMFEATFEYAIHGRNSNFGANSRRRDQADAQAFTAYLRHDWRPSLGPYLGLQSNFGGQTTINGTAQGDSLRSDRVMLGLRWKPYLNQIVNLRLSRDLHVESGFGLDHEWALRWTFLY